MSSFEKLLDKVREANLISEQDATAMLNDYNTAEQERIDAAADAAAGSAFKEGYDQGFTNAKQQAEAEAKKNLDELLAKCDDDATAKLNAVIETLNQEHSAKLQEVYDLLTSTTVPMAEVEAMDEDHAEKFAEALEAKDADCTKKLKIACEAIKKSANKYLAQREKFHTNKFDAYKTISEQKLSKANALLKEERERKMKMLSESVENYLNYALQTAIPTKKLISEAKYNASQKAIEKISSILKINSILQESKDGIFQDYENKINDAKKQANKLMAENVELKNKLEKKEAKLMLESKLTNCTPAEAAFLRTYFSKATSSKIIEEQIEDARAAYKRLHQEKRQAVMNKVTTVSKPSSVVNESKSVKKEEPKKVVAESVKVEKKENKFQNFNDIYAEILKSN